MKKTIPLTDDDKMPMGKFSGKKMRDIPSKYLSWVLEQDWKYFNPPLWGYLRVNAATIKYEADNNINIRKNRGLKKEVDPF